MSNSDLILKTYREITSSLEQPYYVLAGVHGKIRENSILYSSPNIKDVLGLTQIELSRNAQLFYDCIHPNYLEDYFLTNQELQTNGGKIKRFYLLKNSKTGKFSGIEEIAASRLNTEQNRYEIYCSLQSIAHNINPEDLSNKQDLLTFLPPVNNKKETVKKVLDGSSYLLSALQNHYKFFGSRFYIFNNNDKKLHIIADMQNKKDREEFEESVGVSVKSLIPVYSEDNYLFELLLKGVPYITCDHKAISKLLKAHTGNRLLKRMSVFIARIYNIKSFGVIPIINSEGAIAGLVTFASGNNHTDCERKNIIDLVNTSASSLSGHFKDII